MSQQINLYDPALLRKREVLTATNLAAASGALLLLLGIGGGIARSHLAALERENQVLAPQVAMLQAQQDAMKAQLAAMKPDPQVEAELAKVRALLDLHTRQLNELKKGTGAESTAFDEYLRGLARQAPAGLWLTGFAVADGGQSMEIRGRMMDPAALPEYIRRLNGEQAFKGREFSSLKVWAGKEDDAAAPAAPAPALPGAAGPAAAVPATPPAHKPAPAAAPPAAAVLPFYEFTLSPTLARSGSAAEGAMPPGAKR
ncbi:MAG TPA: PilN domain-containing protein [Rhodocyclaceae bacterium]